MPFFENRDHQWKYIGQDTLIKGYQCEIIGKNPLKYMEDKVDRKRLPKVLHGRFKVYDKQQGTESIPLNNT